MDTQKKTTVSYRVHFLFDEPGEELGTKRRRDGSSPQGLCGPRLTQLAHNTSYPAPDRDNRDHQDDRDVAEPFLKKPEGHPGIAHKPVTVVLVVSVVSPFIFRNPFFI